MYAIKDEHNKFMKLGFIADDYNSVSGVTWTDQPVGIFTTTDLDKATKLATLPYHARAVVLGIPPVTLNSVQKLILRDMSRTGDPASVLAAKNLTIQQQQEVMYAYATGSYQLTDVEPKSLVYVPHTNKESIYQKYGTQDKLAATFVIAADTNDDANLFTQEEIEHYGLTHCEKREVADVNS